MGQLQGSSCAASGVGGAPEGAGGAAAGPVHIIISIYELFDVHLKLTWSCRQLLFSFPQSFGQLINSAWITSAH